jgi:TRAP-type C4-dicarboxylate transport system permease small subunit
MKKVFETFSSIVEKISNIFLLISALAVFFIAALNTFDSLGRYIFGHAIIGANELVSVAMTVFVFGGLAMAVRKDRCVAVPVIGERLKPRVRLFVLGIGNLLCVAAGVMMVTQFWSSTLRYLANQTLGTDILKIPLYPFYIYSTIAISLVTVEFLICSIRQLYSGIFFKQNANDHTGEEGAEE